MKITPVEHGIELLEPSVGRSQNLHVSDLYNRFYKEVEPARYDHADDNTTFMSMGLAWEQYLEKRLLASSINAQRPGEFSVDVRGQRVSFSPDLIHSNGHLMGGEIKLTSMSPGGGFDEPKFSKYHTQAMVYGHHLQIPEWIFYVNYMKGDYKKNRFPFLRAYRCEYTAREMREEWETLVAFGKQRRML